MFNRGQTPRGVLAAAQGVSGGRKRRVYLFTARAARWDAEFCGENILLPFYSGQERGEAMHRDGGEEEEEEEEEEEGEEGLQCSCVKGSGRYRPAKCTTGDAIRH